MSRGLGRRCQRLPGRLMWAAMLLVTACSKSHKDSVSGETHFLASCEQRDECGNGLSCLCGVCTRACEGSEACGALSDRVECLAAADRSATCGDDRPMLTCGVSCSGDSECSGVSSDGRCDQGHCLRPPVTVIGASACDDCRDNELAGCVSPVMVDPVEPIRNMTEAIRQSIFVVAGTITDTMPGRSFRAPPDDVDALRTQFLVVEIDEFVTGEEDTLETLYVEIPSPGPEFMPGFGAAACFEEATRDLRVLLFLSPAEAWFEPVFEINAIPATANLYTATQLIGPFYEHDDALRGSHGVPPWLPDVNTLDGLIASIDGISCVSDGVRYRHGESFSDGCNTCSCSGGIVGCTSVACVDPVDPAGAVGSRCQDAGGCAIDLTCREDLWGERPICTRPCKVSCPAPAVCVTDMVDYNGSPLEPLCMRPCTVERDCEPRGTVCNAAGDSPDRYCY